MVGIMHRIPRCVIWLDSHTKNRESNEIKWLKTDAIVNNVGYIGNENFRTSGLYSLSNGKGSAAGNEKFEVWVSKQE